LYGVDYLGAGAVISIHVWAGVSVAIGSVWSKWLLLENRLSIGLYGHLIGVAINIILNFYLIPIYGISGAAFGTMFSYWLSALIVYSLHKPKETFGLLFQAIFFRRVDEAEGNQ
jgi:O-antigen/teichoic acid export membrane protein